MAAHVARLAALAALVGACAFGPAVAQAPAATEEFVPAEETPEELPEGPGREETFYACTPCHGFKIVAQQGQTHRQWEETVDLMVERHKMPAIEAADRKLILDYLAAKYPPRAEEATRGWRNPFLAR